VQGGRRGCLEISLRQAQIEQNLPRLLRQDSPFSGLIVLNTKVEVSFGHSRAGFRACPPRRGDPWSAIRRSPEPAASRSDAGKGSFRGRDAAVL